MAFAHPTLSQVRVERQPRLISSGLSSPLAVGIVTQGSDGTGASSLRGPHSGEASRRHLIISLQGCVAICPADRIIDPGAGQEATVATKKS